jgi:hypothetical protein
VYRNHKNINTAKMQGQVIQIVVSAKKQDCHFKQFIPDQKPRYGLSPAISASIAHFPVGTAANKNSHGRNTQPKQMQSVKIRKSKALVYRIYRFKKVWHSPALPFLCVSFNYRHRFKKMQSFC